MSARSWEGPLFVVGMPRSGTKLLRGLLGQHPAIRIPAWETDFLPLLARWVRERGAPATPAELRRLFEHVRAAPYFVFREQARGPFPWQSWFEACDGRFDAAGLFEGFVRSETGALRGSGLIWGDKSPSYMEHLPLLVELFPAARIVHLVRDVRDYCVSIRKAWGKDVRRAAVRWSASVARAHEYCREAPDRFCEIHYERLISEPEAELRRLSAFVGVTFDSGMLQTGRPVENRGDARGRSDIKRDNAGKYAAVLTRHELAAIEALAWNEMRTLGYAPELARGPKRLSTAALGALRLKDGVALALSGARERGLLASLRFFAAHQRVTRP